MLPVLSVFCSFMKKSTGSSLLYVVALLYWLTSARRLVGQVWQSMCPPRGTAELHLGCICNYFLFGLLLCRCELHSLVWLCPQLTTLGGRRACWLSYDF